MNDPSPIRRHDNSPLEFEPGQERPLARKIAAHRAQSWGLRNQYSAFDKANDEDASYGGFDDPGSPYWGFGFGPYNTFRVGFGLEHWWVRIVFFLVVALLIWIARSSS